MSESAAKPARLLAVGAVAIAVGFAIGSLSRPSGPGPRPGGAPLDADAMQAALGEVLREPDTLARAHALQTLLEQMGPDNVAGVERALDPLVVGLEDCDVEAVLHARAAFDPRGAFEHARRWPAVHKRALGVSAAVFVWALRGGALEARSAVGSLATDEVHKAGLFSLLRGWANSDDVDGATRFLAQMPEDENGTREKVLTTFVTNSLLAYGGPDRLLAWFDEIPEDAPNRFKRAAFRNALLQLASERPDLAVAFYEANEGRAYRDHSLWLLAVAWQKLDPEAALAWLLERAPEEGRNDAMRRAMQRWHSRDRVAAARWVAGADLPEDPKLRRALHGIVLRGPRAARRGADS